MMAAGELRASAGAQKASEVRASLRLQHRYYGQSEPAEMWLGGNSSVTLMELSCKTVCMV